MDPKAEQISRISHMHPVPKILLRTAFAACLAGAVLDWIFAFEAAPPIGLATVGKVVALCIALGPLGLFLSNRDRWSLIAALLLAARALTSAADLHVAPETTLLSTASTLVGIGGWVFLAHTLSSLPRWRSLARLTSILAGAGAVAWAAGWSASETSAARPILDVGEAIMVTAGPIVGISLLGASLAPSERGRERGRRFLLAGAWGAALIAMAAWGLGDLGDAALIPLIGGAILLVLGYVGIGRRGSRWGYAAAILGAAQLAIIPAASELLRRDTREVVIIASLTVLAGVMAIAHARIARSGGRWAAYGTTALIVLATGLMFFAARSAGDATAILLFAPAALAVVHFAVAADGVALNPVR